MKREKGTLDVLAERGALICTTGQNIIFTDIDALHCEQVWVMSHHVGVSGSDLAQWQTLVQTRVCSMNPPATNSYPNTSDLCTTSSFLFFFGPVVFVILPPQSSFSQTCPNEEMERAEKHVNPLLVMFAQSQDTDFKILQTILKGNSLHSGTSQVCNLCQCLYFSSYL